MSDTKRDWTTEEGLTELERLAFQTKADHAPGSAYHQVQRGLATETTGQRTKRLIDADDALSATAREAVLQLVERIREQDKRLFELRETIDDYDAQCRDLKRERDVVETVDIHGTWIWSDTDPNHIESMGAEMVVTMTAGQLRKMLAEQLKHPDLLDAMHELLCVDSCMEERVEAAEKLAKVIGHEWPPYPNACAEDCEKDHEHE